MEDSQTHSRILNIVSLNDSSNSNGVNGSGITDNKTNQVTIIEKRRRMLRRNAVTQFFCQGKQNISRIFPDNKSPDQLKWKSISSKFRLKKKRHNTVITKGHTLPLIQSPKDTACSSKSASFFVPEIAPQSTKGTSCVPVQEQIFQSSILSTYPIMSLLEEYMKENVDEVDENSTDELFEHWISEFVDTCQRQIKTIILTTNDKLSRHIDLSNMTHLSGQEQVVKISSIPMWTQVRILEDSSNQKYIALEKAHSLSWFVLPRECPKLSQRWVCYPINSMNTFENEVRAADGNSIRLMLLRMVIMKCFCKIHKNDIMPVKLDSDNILLISSNCGLIVVFREGEVDLDVASFDILRCETLADVANQHSVLKTDVNETISKFFYRLTVISVLIRSIWPLDLLAYILAKLVMDSEN